MKNLIIFYALGMSIFAFASLTVAFVTFRFGYYIYEPNHTRAIIEACVAGVFTLLSLWAFIIYIKSKDVGLSKKDISKGFKKLMDEINKEKDSLTNKTGSEDK